ncbi:hypothetical protein PFISCL1PPCAC_4050, partial [Pristionchus fissidentatus]
HDIWDRVCSGYSGYLCERLYANFGYCCSRRVEGHHRDNDRLLADYCSSPVHICSITINICSRCDRRDNGRL